MAAEDWLFPEDEKEAAKGRGDSSFIDEKFDEPAESPGESTAPAMVSNQGSDVIQNVGKVILGHLRDTADVLGENPIVFEQMYEQYESAFWKDVDRDLFRGRLTTSGPDLTGTGHPAEARPMWFLEDPDGFKALLGYARNWWGAKIGPGVSEAWVGGSGRGGGGGGGRGRTLPTEKQIRQQFDLNQLGRRASDLWRAFLLDEPGDARQLAKSYVDEIVKSRGEQKIDFDSFIEQKIEDSPRYAAIMKNKPAGMRADQYLQGYYQTAMNVLRPDNAEDAAIGAAQFGADAGAFQQRLKRSNEARTSAPFMESLEGRLRSVKGVLKG